jgi:hypothetical protein
VRDICHIEDTLGRIEVRALQIEAKHRTIRIARDSRMSGWPVPIEGLEREKRCSGKYDKEEQHEQEGFSPERK